MKTENKSSQLYCLVTYLYAANAILEVFKVITRRTEENFKVKMVIIRKVNEMEKKQQPPSTTPGKMIVLLRPNPKLGLFH